MGCSDWFNIRSYPTIRMVCGKYVFQQEYHNKRPLDARSMATWAREVSNEWTWLFTHADLIDLTAHNFAHTVYNSTDFWLVMFTDGFDCGACKTAKTNMMRLSAGFKGIAKSGVVNCETDENLDFCYEKFKLPQAPHLPQIRGFRKGNKTSNDLGEMLYNPNSVEPHLAIEIIE